MDLLRNGSLKMKLLLTILCFGFSCFLMGQSWHQDFDAALQQAAEESKPLILVFAGSDWCAPCIKLDRNIWTSDVFKTYAEDHYVLYKADFPRKKKNRLPQVQLDQNKGLAEKYNARGYFPLVLVLDSNASVLGTMGYENVSAKHYIDRLNSFLK